MDLHGTRLTIELGDLVAALYDAFMEEYHNEQLALLATTKIVQERVAARSIELTEARTA